jgi:hypothetical protein
MPVYQVAKLLLNRFVGNRMTFVTSWMSRSSLALTGRNWSLFCLWLLADQHREELTIFTSKMGADAAHFSALTYQELFARMVPFVGQANAEYIAYLRERYMSDSVV